MNLIVKYNALIKAQKKYRNAFSEMQSLLRDKFSFEIEGLSDFEGDGICVMAYNPNPESSDSVPTGMQLSSVLGIIERKGIVEKEDWFPVY